MPAPRLIGLVVSGVVFVAIGLRLAVESPGAADLPNRLVPGLIAAALLCVAGLTIRRGSALAWFAIVFASGIGAIEIVAVVRAWHPTPTAETWLGLTLVAALASIIAATVAVRYATASRPGRPSMTARVLAGVGLGLVLGGELWAIGSAAGQAVAGVTVAVGAGPDVLPIRVATRLMLGTMAVLGVVGAARDVWPAARRAWLRRRAGVRYPRLLMEELVPAWSGSGRAAAEQERAALAAELHARVVPELRSALAATAGSDPDGAISERLRGTLDDVETLMAERHSIVLDEFGLLAALEWLAERVQVRSGAEVTVEVADVPASEGSGRPPRDVERAAFRVTLLALDNATRHAPGSPIVIRAAIDAGAVAIEVRDRGPGLESDRANEAARAGRRGVVDMRNEASLVRARLEIDGVHEAGAATSGTRIVFRWPSA